MANIRPVGVPFDRTFRNTINENFEVLGDAVDGIGQAVTDAEEAKSLAESVQTQLDEVTGASTIDPAVEQLKVGSDGVTVYPSPDARVRTEINRVTTDLAEKATKDELDALGEIKLEGSYETLAELESSKPTGAAGLYLVIEDGYTYRWDETSWVKVVQFQSTGIANEGVDKFKLAPDSIDYQKHTPYVPIVFKSRPRNLFDKNSVITGYYVVRLTGELAPHSNYTASDFIPVIGGLPYARHVTDQGAWYDINKTYISGIAYTDSNVLTAPENAKYLRVSTTIGDLPKQMVEQSSAVNSYEPNYTDMKIDADDYLNKNSASVEILKEEVMTIKQDLSNLFDIDTALNGYAIDRNNGSVVENPSYLASDWIPVSGGDTYSQNDHLHTGAWYDENKVFISGIPYDETKKQVVSPANAKFLRTSVHHTKVDSFMLVKGDVIPTNYVPFHKKVSDILIESISQRKLKTIPDIARDIIFTPGSIIDLWGDSRTQGVGGTGYAEDGDYIPGTTVRMNPHGHCWANSLRDLLQWKYGVTVRNYGQSGKNSRQIYDQMNTLVDQNPDLIIIMLGTNDRHNLANVEETKKYQRDMINLAHSRGIRVILMSAPATSVEQDNDSIRNFGMYDLDKAMNELAYEFGMDYISNYSKSLLYTEYRNISPDDLQVDGLHENDLGHDVIFRNVVRSLGISHIRKGVTK